LAGFSIRNYLGLEILLGRDFNYKFNSLNSYSVTKIIYFILSCGSLYFSRNWLISLKSLNSCVQLHNSLLISAGSVVTCPDISNLGFLHLSATYLLIVSFQRTSFVIIGLLFSCLWFNWFLLYSPFFPLSVDLFLSSVSSIWMEEHRLLIRLFSPFLITDINFFLNTALAVYHTFSPIFICTHTNIFLYIFETSF
jgi:hypothetical protein